MCGCLPARKGGAQLRPLLDLREFVNRIWLMSSPCAEGRGSITTSPGGCEAGSSRTSPSPEGRGSITTGGPGGLWRRRRGLPAQKGGAPLRRLEEVTQSGRRLGVSLSEGRNSITTAARSARPGWCPGRVSLCGRAGLNYDPVFAVTRADRLHLVSQPGRAGLNYDSQALALRVSQVSVSQPGRAGLNYDIGVDVREVPIDLPVS